MSDTIGELCFLGSRILALVGVVGLLRKSQSVNEVALSSDQADIQNLLTFEHENISIRNCLLSTSLSLDKLEIQEQVSWVFVLHLCIDCSKFADE